MPIIHITSQGARDRITFSRMAIFPMANDRPTARISVEAGGRAVFQFALPRIKQITSH